MTESKLGSIVKGVDSFSEQFRMKIEKEKDNV